MAKIIRAVILGAPASGKGTVSSRIIEKFNFQHISVGDQLRLEVKNNSDFGTEIQKYLNKGILLPDSLMIEFLTVQINKLAKKSWLLDGFPRTLPQAHALTPHNLDFVLNLDVPFDIIISRAKNRWVHFPSGRVYNMDFNAPKLFGIDDVTGEPLAQRADDDPVIVSKRLQIYEQSTRPVLQYYLHLGILQTFSGKTTNEIWPQIEKYLDNYLSEERLINNQ
ncbi:hypothetical protein FQA39_LY16111 [Lamprigera yunnana]|nr:hypothetical protein FQA39_LY16111 [Lamprigera yunnana]